MPPRRKLKRWPPTLQTFFKRTVLIRRFAAFNAGGDWRDGDLYVFVIDKTGTWRASGARPELIGTKVDLDKPMVKEMLAIDKSAWVDYKFKSPADNQEHDKSSYIVRVGDFLVGAGAYKY